MQQVLTCSEICKSGPCWCHDLTGADKLRKQVSIAARENDALDPDGPIAPMLAAVARVRAQPVFVREVCKTGFGIEGCSIEE